MQVIFKNSEIDFTSVILMQLENKVTRTQVFELIEEVKSDIENGDKIVTKFKKKYDV